MSESSLLRGSARRARPEPPVPQVEPARLAVVHATLLGWYARAGRDLPWRRTRDPYAILVAEIMLQQTQVDRVIPKYHQFLAAFPTLAALAAASVADAIRLWTGLGYNRRAVRLHAIARTAVERLGGSLPPTPEGLQELEGLGVYTANAVASFAFDAQVAVVDTNVRRVLGRLFADAIGLEPTPGPPLQRFANSVLPPGRAYAWNQALMDLGATICTARAPNHTACPLAEYCVGRALLVALPRPVRLAAERPAEYRAAVPFERTTRYFRGRIVERLCQLGPSESLPIQNLGDVLPEHPGEDRQAWIVGLVDGLRRDGLVAVTETESGPRVSLP